MGRKRRYSLQQWQKAAGNARVTKRQEIEARKLVKSNPPPADLNFYQERDKLLRKMKFSCYGDYLRSDLWLGIRERVMVRDYRHCWCCDAKATEVHHRRYDKATLSGNDLSGMVAICHECHKKVEFDFGGNKHTHPGLVDKALVQLRADRHPKRYVEKKGWRNYPPTNRCNISGTKQDDYWSQQPTRARPPRHR